MTTEHTRGYAGASPKGLATAALLLFSAGTLVLQFLVLTGSITSSGAPFWIALLFFFTFFTNLSNILVVLVLLGAVLPHRSLDWTRSPRLRGFAVAAIGVVGVVFHFLLVDAYEFSGLLAYCVFAMHYAIPALFTLWWILASPHGALHLSQLWVWLLPFVGYFAFALLYGLATGAPVYPFFDFADGVWPVLGNTLLLSMILLAVVVAIWSLDRALARPSD